MEKFWLYIYPYCFIWSADKVGLIYNTQKGKGVEIRINDKIKRCLDEFNDLKNLYCLELTENLLNNKEIRAFISEIHKLEAGKLIKTDSIQMKPAFFPPILNLQHDIDRLRKDPDRSLGKDIMRDLPRGCLFMFLAELLQLLFF